MKAGEVRRLLPPLLLLAVIAPLAACVTTSATYADPVTGRRSGKLLFERRCAECHALYSPSSYTAAQWAPIVDEMGDLAHLSDEDRGLILDYLAGR